MLPTKITLARHGRTDWNAEGRVQGHIDRPLDEVGLSEARLLAQRLGDLPIQKMVSSDLLRAYTTAEIIAESFSFSVQRHSALREVHYGKIEGLLWKEFRKEYQEKISQYEALSWQERKQFRYTETSESYGEVIDRVVPFLHELCMQNISQHMMIVTHGGVIKALLAELMGADDRKVHSKNTGYVTLAFHAGRLEVDEIQGIDLNWEGVK